MKNLPADAVLAIAFSVFGAVAIGIFYIGTIHP